MVRLRSPAPMSGVTGTVAPDIQLNIMGEFPSGQRGQTVNLLSLTSMVRIHLPPPSQIFAVQWTAFLLLLSVKSPFSNLGLTPAKWWRDFHDTHLMHKILCRQRYYLLNRNKTFYFRMRVPALFGKQPVYLRSGMFSTCTYKNLIHLFIDSQLIGN